MAMVADTDGRLQGLVHVLNTVPHSSNKLNDIKTNTVLSINRNISCAQMLSDAAMYNTFHITILGRYTVYDKFECAHVTNVPFNDAVTER